MGWTEELSGLRRAMEDIEDPRGAELRDHRDRLRHLEVQQAAQATRPGSGQK